MTLNRWGGNAMSCYNWALSTANSCQDYFYNLPPGIVGDAPKGRLARAGESRDRRWSGHAAPGFAAVAAPARGSALTAPAAIAAIFFLR